MSGEEYQFILSAVNGLKADVSEGFKNVYEKIDEMKEKHQKIDWKFQKSEAECENCRGDMGRRFKDQEEKIKALLPEEKRKKTDETLKRILLIVAVITGALIPFALFFYWLMQKLDKLGFLKP